MARKRMIDPEFWGDGITGKLDYPVQLLYIGMWNFADDEGLIRWDASYLKSCVFPYKNVQIEETEKWMGEIRGNGLIFIYGRPKQKYAWIINFRNHQVINRPQPSKLPAPPIQNLGYKCAILSRDKMKCCFCGETVLERGDHNLRGNRYSLHHVVPKSEGGTDYPTNLKCACISCNKADGGRLSLKKQGRLKDDSRPEDSEDSVNNH